MQQGPEGQHEQQQRAETPATWVVRPDPDLQDLVPSFLRNRRNELQEMDGALARGDFEFIRRLAHTWKGICRPYGFVHLETLSRILEETGQREDRQEATAIVGEIRTYLDNVRVVFDS